MNTVVRPAPPAPAHMLNSRYSVQRLADGWSQFDVVGATGPKAPWWLLVVGPLFGGSLGFQIGPSQAVGGVLAGFFLALCFAVGRASSIGTFGSRRAPAGSFLVGPDGVKLPNGRFLHRERIRRLLCRNVQDGMVHTSVGVGGGMVGGLTAMGAARHAADANLFLPISYQLDLEADGQSYPVVGSLTAATAHAVFEDVSRLLGLS